jgi:hypothetical protein
MTKPEGNLALVSELFLLLDDIDTGSLIPPDVEFIPVGATELGQATGSMKRLWTLFVTLSREHKLGMHELLLRAVHTALSFEIGAYFNCWEARCGITRDWKVYATRNQ